MLQRSKKSRTFPTPSTEASVTTKPKAKSEAIEAVEKVAERAVEAAAPVEAMAAAGSETIVKGVEKAMEMAKQQADKASALAAKSLEDVSKASRSTYETWMQSGDTLAKGLERVNKSVLSYAQYSLDANLSAARQLMSCASVNEAMEIQATLVKSSFDSLLAESSKVSEITASMLKDAFAPLGSQFKDRVEKLWKPLAA
jgi:phasin family protein